MNITLHIEHLVLDGLPLTVADGAVVRAAVQAELGRLLTESGLAPELQRGGHITGVNGGGFCPSPIPTVVGQQVGRAVYGGLST